VTQNNDRLHGASQDITLAGDFTGGTRQDAITFLTGFTGNPADQRRKLSANAIISIAQRRFGTVNSATMALPNTP
jgi:hypothetical protein